MARRARAFQELSLARGRRLRLGQLSLLRRGGDLFAVPRDLPRFGDGYGLGGGAASRADGLDRNDHLGVVSWTSQVCGWRNA